jgi:hypothetical protein
MHSNEEFLSTVSPSISTVSVGAVVAAVSATAVSAHTPLLIKTTAMTTTNGTLSKSQSKGEHFIFDDGVDTYSILWQCDARVWLV